MIEDDLEGLDGEHGFDKEIEAVRQVFGSLPIAGFLTYGEIARYPGKLNGAHRNRGGRRQPRIREGEATRWHCSDRTARAPSEKGR